MPLTPVQSAIAGLIAVNRSPSSHLAGAAALHLEPNSPRTSDGLDYFHDGELIAGQAFAADCKVLEASGYEVKVILSQPGFVRAIVGRGGQATKVEWAHDTSWRFLPPILDPAFGYRLHPIDLSINKVLALAGRDEPRDYLDVIYVHRNHLSVGSLCWAAVGKDSGYSPEMLVELLARKGRYRSEDFAPLNLATAPEIEDLKRAWLQAVADARRLARELPPQDAGCLYWDPVGERFVTPAGDLTRLVRHFGCRGGVLPSVGDQPQIAYDRQSRLLLKQKQRLAPPARTSRPRTKRLDPK